MNNAQPGKSAGETTLTVTQQDASWGGSVIEIKEGDAELRVAVKKSTAGELLKLAADVRYRAALLLERAALIERAAQVLDSPESTSPVLPSIARS